LQLQVLVNNFQPYTLGITLQGQQGNGHVGLGSDGLQYFLMRVG